MPLASREDWATSDRIRRQAWTFSGLMTLVLQGGRLMPRLRRYVGGSGFYIKDFGDILDSFRFRVDFWDTLDSFRKEAGVSPKTQTRPLVGRRSPFTPCLRARHPLHSES